MVRNQPTDITARKSKASDILVRSHQRSCHLIARHVLKQAAERAKPG
jgi:hypothetical protein